MQQAQHIDYQGLATLIAAVGSFVVVVIGGIVTGVLQVLAYNRQTRQLLLSQQQAQSNARIEALVNGNTARLHDIVEKAVTTHTEDKTK